MPLAAPQLDDLTFQQIVDYAKRLIPRYCPEWTDHNVSDPGVTLIELFASMTEMLLFRVNQVPEKMYITFLNFIGARLAPATPAQVEVTFYLSKMADKLIVIDPETQVTTVRTETQEPIIFSTREKLSIRPTKLLMLYRMAPNNSAPDASDSQVSVIWEPIDVDLLNNSHRPNDVFPSSLVPGDALYLALNANVSRHVLALECRCVYAHGGGASLTEPPIIWEAWQEQEQRWEACSVEADETGGFNRDGRILLHLPYIGEGAKNQQLAYWVRCRLTDQQLTGKRYEASPQLTHIHAESRGGTIAAQQAVVAEQEYLGESDGTSGQVFRLRHAPLLARDEVAEYLELRYADDQREAWVEQPHFGASQPDSQHYTLDAHDGTLTLGPLLRQPDGKVIRFGKVPPRGARLYFTKYRYGGGTAGNVARDTITVLKSSLDNIQRVTNRIKATEGRDGQTVDDLKRMPPEVLGLRARAVTANDYEYLGVRVPSVARVRCLAPGRRPAAGPTLRLPNETLPGQVTILVVPTIREALLSERIPEHEIELPENHQLLQSVWRELDARAPLGCDLFVRSPRYLWVSVNAKIRTIPGTTAAHRDDLQRQAIAALYHYLNPINRGDGQGWPFDGELHYWDLQNLLRNLPSVRAIEEVQLRLTRRNLAVIVPQPEPVPTIELARDELICSDIHTVEVS